MGVIVELGVPYTGWPVRSEGDYAFGLDRLSADLIASIEAWAREFNHLFDHEHGWRSREDEQRHRKTGEQLAQRLQKELGAGWTVKLTGL